MNKWLTGKGVPAWELASLLGHDSGFRITELYTENSPDHLSMAVRAIDAIFEEIRGELDVSDLQFCLKSSRTGEKPYPYLRSRRSVNLENCLTNSC